MVKQALWGGVGNVRTGRENMSACGSRQDSEIPLPLRILRGRERVKDGRV